MTLVEDSNGKAAPIITTSSGLSPAIDISHVDHASGKWCSIGNGKLACGAMACGLGSGGGGL
jgi:hypothetical protein